RAGIFKGDGVGDVAQSEDRFDQQVFDVCVWVERGAVGDRQRVGRGVCAGADADTDDVFFVGGACAVDGSCAGGSGASERGDGVADDVVGEFAGVVAGDIGRSDLHVHDVDIDIRSGGVIGWHR